MEQLRDAWADEGDAEQVAVVEVDHHSGATPATAGAWARPVDLSDFDVDRPHTMRGPPGANAARLQPGGPVGPFGCTFSCSSAWH